MVERSALGASNDMTTRTKGDDPPARSVAARKLVGLRRVSQPATHRRDIAVDGRADQISLYAHKHWALIEPSEHILIRDASGRVR